MADNQDIIAGITSTFSNEGTLTLEGFSIINGVGTNTERLLAVHGGA